MPLTAMERISLMEPELRILKAGTLPALDSGRSEEAPEGAGDVACNRFVLANEIRLRSYAEGRRRRSERWHTCGAA